MEEDVQVISENVELTRRYSRLLRKARPILNDGDTKVIRTAFNLANEAHGGARRRSGEPYIFHPMEVAEICITEIGLGTTSIVAALLHDVVEDTDYTVEDIEKRFGRKVARIIDGLTKISGVYEHGSSQQAENFRKMLLTLSDDVRVILVKLADRLHNMRTLQSLPREKQLKIASETIYLYAPLAHRLGLYSIKSEMEDLYLKYTNEDVFLEIKEKLKGTKQARARFIRSFIKPIDKSIKDSGFSVEIKGRPKSIYSIWNKMQKQGVTFEEIFDLFAIRIIIDTDAEQEKAACWQIYSLVTDHYKPNPDRLRDWVSTPKANGYESLHTTVMSEKGQWVEVQIRSRRMDDIAERGYAAHWKYKENGTQESGLDDWIRRVRDALAENDVSAIEFVDDFRSNLFSDEVFVFTPKGDLKTLPNGATALDFAFEIHTQVGGKCIGAKVNQKLVPINYKLKNGDQVEILTSVKQKPSEDWLKHTVSSKARTKIKDLLKEEKKAAASDGKEIVERKLKQMRLGMNNDILNQLVAHFSLRTPLDFYYRVGKGRITGADIKRFQDSKVDVSKNGKTRISDPKAVVKQIEKKSDNGSDVLLIGEDMEELEYKFAKCCNPIPGDDVFGFVTVTEGVKIHRTNCPNAIELMSNYGYRVIKAKWASQQSFSFLSEIKVVGIDRMGMINDITEKISNNLKVNMKSIQIETDGGIFEGKIQLYINDTSHLEKLTTEMESVNGVVSVSRIK